MSLLKDHADLGLLVVDEVHLSRRRFQQPRENPQESGFARTRGAQKTYKITRTYFKGNIIKRMQTTVAVRENNGEIFYGEDGKSFHGVFYWVHVAFSALCLLNTQHAKYNYGTN
jgi:hypothetical protein